MSNINPAQLDRAQQRFWLAALAAGVGLATLHLVVFPQSPPLPQPPASALLPPPWQAAAASLGPASQHTSLLQRNVAIGPSKRFANGRDWLLLTPLASWQEAALDPAAITTTIPELHLQQAQQQTPSQAKQQIGRGRIQGQTSYQTCLTRTGALASTAAGLGGTSGAPHLDFLRTLLRGRLPPLPRPSFSCLLVTTNSLQGLAGGSNSNTLLAALESHTQWPR
ncbi:hypothetical protein KQ300_02805 [Synechococcus sp. CS-1331]|uniref:hypothetical protein n=1 Tax=Synechococcus sp. CS-1331 TaxID=2847973 RepID=UPI00223A9083|nr:hypothetical protein [Synechococcus sp. CS-1331]MCT0227126.1 hypothetical protein [Synechococcus sp. CS-1331]